MSANLDRELLKILVRPKCGGELKLSQNGDGLICKTCQLKCPIEGGIPIMLIDRAVPLSQEGL